MRNNYCLIFKIVFCCTSALKGGRVEDSAMVQESHWHSSSYCLQVSLLTLDKAACLSKAASCVNVLPSCMCVCHVCPLLEEIIKGVRSS